MGLREDMDEGLQRIWRQLDDESANELMSKWVLVVECINADGERWLRSMRGPDTLSWDVRGMLGSALADVDTDEVVGALEAEE